MTFRDKVVAITGAAGGVGQSLCRYFIDEGAKVAAIDKKTSVEGLAAELKADPRRFAHAVADITEPAEVERAFAFSEPARWAQSTSSSTTPADRAMEPWPARMRQDGGKRLRSMWTAPISAPRLSSPAWWPDIRASSSISVRSTGSRAWRSGLQRRQGGDDLAHPLIGAGIWTSWHSRQYRAAGHDTNPSLGEARRQGSQGPRNAAALVSSRPHRRACRCRESGRVLGVRRRLGDHRRGSARWIAD